jgi:hypothetical protein
VNDESISHLLFQCSYAKVVWAVVAHCIGADNIPKTINQCWAWCNKWLPSGKQFHALGVTAICWAIWKTQNIVCFEGHVVNNPISIICHACSMMSYWAGLFPKTDKEALVAGANTMLQIALKLLGKKMVRKDQLLLTDGQGDSQDEDEE